LIGGLVTVIAVIGILPYISLQLKAVSSSFAILLQYPQIVMPQHVGMASIVQDTAFYVALFMALFTIAFGTRALDVSERHEDMVAINLFVLPIAFGGRLAFPEGNVDADTFVLTLPMVFQQEGIALLVFIGGLSAATGMVIVETIALSTMVCNDLAMPTLLRWK